MTRPDVAKFFEDDQTGSRLFEEIARMIDTLGESKVRPSKSQIAFRHGRTFAPVWRPGMYVATTVPLVPSIALPRRPSSARFKQVVHPAPDLDDAPPRATRSLRDRRRGARLAGHGLDRCGQDQRPTAARLSALPPEGRDELTEDERTKRKEWSWPSPCDTVGGNS